MTDPTRLLALAEECERATAANYELECRIGQAIEWPTTVPPPFTADAGAALRLVPSRFQDWNIRRRNGERHDVELCIPSHEVHGMGHTLPLAICAASLRALAEEASDGE